MNINRIISESIVEFLSEEDVWFHGTPDERELKANNSFMPRTDSTDIITDPQKYSEVQQQMQQARASGDEDKYFSLLDQAGDLRKSITYKKPIYFTNNSSVAKTYADPHRAFDYQNSEPALLKVSINTDGNVLKVPAFGESFRGIKVDLVINALRKAGIPEEKINKYIAMFPNYIRNGKMSAETLAIIAQLLKFDIVDVLGVLDSYHVGNIKSTVRMVFDPNRIKIIR